MDLNAVQIFCRVVQAGSFSGAARSLQLPKSTVSHKVALLEQSLQTALIKRTTRKLTLTEAGETFYRAAFRSLTELTDAQAQVQGEHQGLQGLLRVTAPVEMGTTVLAEGVARFLKLNPDITLELILTDRVVDLVAENVDLAIRAGGLEDSSLVARKLGTSGFQLYASPKYLAGIVRPKEPKDLEKLECLLFTTLSPNGTWLLLHDETNRKSRIHVKGRAQANNLSALHSLALQGLGVALLPDFLCASDVENGRLIPLLPRWRSEQSPVHLVYPSHRFVPARVRAFVDFLSKDLKIVF